MISILFIFQKVDEIGDIFNIDARVKPVNHLEYRLVASYHIFHQESKTLYKLTVEEVTYCFRSSSIDQYKGKGVLSGFMYVS